MSKLLSKEQVQTIKELKRDISFLISKEQLSQMLYNGKITNNDFYEYCFIIDSDNEEEETEDYEIDLIEKINRIFLKWMLGDLD